MASEEKSESASASAAAPSGGGSKLVLALTAVNIIASVGMAGILVISFQKESHKASVEDIAVHGGEKDSAKGEKKEGAEGETKSETKKKNMDFGKMVTLEQFTVNLSTPGSVNPKFVRVNISIEVPTDDSEGEVTQKMPQVRNAIIDLFNSKRSADLATAEGRDYIKEEIKNALNSFLVTGKVKGVYFTNFAVSN